MYPNADNSCLGILQNVCVRLGMPIITTAFPPDSDSIDIDYDLNYLISALNARIKQYTVMNLFPYQRFIKSIPINSVSFVILPPTKEFPHFFLFLEDRAYPGSFPYQEDFCNLVNSSFKIFSPSTNRTFLFRELSPDTFGQLAQNILPTVVSNLVFPPTEIFPTKNKDFPSEDISNKLAAVNLESGFYRIRIKQWETYYFVNNLLTREELIAPAMATFIYQSQFAVFGSEMQMIEQFLTDNNLTFIESELLIVSVVADYKRHYGLPSDVEENLAEQLKQKLILNSQSIVRTDMHPKLYLMDAADANS
jgi:hypothetical protein